MQSIQLELNIDNKTPQEYEIFLIQNQIDSLNESMGKMRRKLFSEMGELRKICESLKRENQELKDSLRELKNEETAWEYEKEGYLFDISDYREATS